MEQYEPYKAVFSYNFKIESKINNDFTEQWLLNV